MYMYLKVLSDPWRRGFRTRTGTDVQTVHVHEKKKSFFLVGLSLGQSLNLPPGTARTVRPYYSVPVQYYGRTRSTAA